MSDEIKVPPGYWASEVGVIPKEWEVKELGKSVKPRREQHLHDLCDLDITAMELFIG